MSRIKVDNHGHLQQVTDNVEKDAGVVRTLRGRYRKIAVAAAVFVLLAGGWWLFRNPQPASTVTELSVAGAVHKITQRGEMKYLLLPDSTQVWLNVASTLDFPETIGVMKESMVAAWTTDRLAYTSRPVSDILQDLERNYNVTIELADSTLGEEIFTTSFRRDIGVEEALEIICKATDRKLSVKNGIYTISRK